MGELLFRSALGLARHVAGRAGIDADGLTVPHPRIAERAFVLVPLLEVSPEVVIPDIGPARDALAMIGTCGCEALG